ncbi:MULTISPECIES: iron-sulfur cluster assembly scaffold protein [Dictyoglomus]|jgi:nitrogen fixation NifU-like protein|uniref:Nitrogen-fixing NifU domain protein n=1 Tax=Dictyoglomus turgidum (strain DSM 6724 / Z-1310) TaxID=515635 RepID=B8DZS2_DICTD|nr:MULTISPECIES: iron-sulfur cluster assembly scaffold protein [Dictyoglomus]ACK42005.1 nitrogen-fixing NifU domain protein [Dictyoglomus turgidum DSM 6724]PNV80908.1 MAG: iron-sulfur cluster assembly scaffold protein [Dictyoglomus turgidum]HBU31435.1 iron-sulfur cluster assembly scaffold protein [Dictyoglomus sp.]
MLRYTDIVLEHFKNPRNVGVIEDPDGYAIEGSPACGDQIVVYIKVDPNTKVITDIKFQSFGCASNIATGSMMTEMVKGKTIEEALKLTWKDVVDALGGLPPVKLHCSVLAIDGLKAAIRNYLGEKTEGKLSKEEVVNVLSNVLYPSLAVDIVTLKLLNFLKITEKGKVIIELLLGEEDPFKEHIKEEIVEKLSKINGVKEVEVNFVK